MNSSEIRAKARESLTGKWGKAALLTFIYGILIYAIGFVLKFIPIIGPIANAIISVPLGYGFIASLMKLKRNEEVGYLDFFTIGFSSFSKVWSVTLNTVLKLLVPIIIMIVLYVLLIVSSAGVFVGATMSYDTDISSVIAGMGGFALLCVVAIFADSIYMAIKSLLYSLNNYILYDNPNMSGKEIVEKSASLMMGNRWKLFCLQLSFIGWAILTSLTFGIGMFWLIPYMSIAIVAFYEMLAGASNNKPAEVVENTEAQDNPIQ